MEKFREVALTGKAYELAVDNVGIYPMSVTGGNNAYAKRTERMEGHNECVHEITKNAGILSDFLETLDEITQDLVLEGQLRISVHEGKCELWVLCNDLFYWGCADGENITLEEIKDLTGCYLLTAEFGDILWCCRKREMRPQAAYYKYIPPEQWALFDAAGPERTDPDGKRNS